MGNSSKNLLKVWSEKLAFFKKVMAEILDKESLLLASLKGKSSSEIALIKLELADLTLDLLSYNILLSDLSKALIKVRSENYLNEARKLAYKSIIYLEDVVSAGIDIPFSDYEDKLKEIESFSDSDRLQLVNKLGFSIQLVIDGLGVNSKWKWSYPDLRGRYAVVLKNLINLKKYVAEFDPRSTGYQERFIMMNKVKQSFISVAQAYREKYELTTQRIDDIRLAITYLAALKRIHMILGEPENVDEIKKKIGVWKAKMEDDSRKQEGNVERNKRLQQQEDQKKKKKGFFSF